VLLATSAGIRLELCAYDLLIHATVPPKGGAALLGCPIVLSVEIPYAL
jgi:hypothetical protein